jgi:DNA-binding transcriptional ArsR family regulator
MSKRPSVYLIQRDDQLAVMVSPVRQEILDALAAAGPSSAAELATRLGRPADALYHHLRLLIRSGLLVEHSRRRTLYRTEVIYAPVRMARRFTAHVDTRSSKSRKHWEQAVATLLRLGIGDFRRAVRGPSIVTDGSQRNLWCGRIKAYLAKDQLARANRLMSELFSLLTHGRLAPNAKLYAVTCLLVPCQPAKRTRKPSAKSARRSSPPSARGAQRR